MGAPQWHAIEGDDALAALRSSRSGLSTTVAQARLSEVGTNWIAPLRPEAPLTLLWRQLSSPLVAVLILSGVAALALGELADGLVVLAVVAFNSAIGFLQQWRAGRAIQALSALVPERARVARDGTRRCSTPKHSCRATSSSCGRAIAFTLPANLGEALIILVAVEAIEPDIMRRPPRPPRAPVVGRLLIVRTIVVSVLMAVAALALFEVREDQTIVITTIVLFQVVSLLECRSLDHGVRHVGLWTNPWALAGIGAVLVLQAAFVYASPLQDVFGSAPLSAADWLLALAAPFEPQRRVATADDRPVDRHRSRGRQHDRLGRLPAAVLAGGGRRPGIAAGLDLHRRGRRAARARVRQPRPRVPCRRRAVRLRPPGVRRLRRLPDGLGHPLRDADGVAWSPRPSRGGSSSWT